MQPSARRNGGKGCPLGITSDEVLERFYTGVPPRRDLGRYETFYANDKAKRLVGFSPGHPSSPATCHCLPWLERWWPWLVALVVRSLRWRASTIEFSCAAAPVASSNDLFKTFG